METPGGNQPLSTTYATIGTALYNLFDGLSISGIYPSGWALKANYPLKEPGQMTTWPAFSVVPVEDAETDLDSITDDDSVHYHVFLYDTFENSSVTEGKMRQLVDLARTELRKQKRSSTPLGNGAYTVGDITGAWGYDDAYGIRYYRFTIQGKVDQATQ